MMLECEGLLEGKTVKIGDVVLIGTKKAIEEEHTIEESLNIHAG